MAKRGSAERWQNVVHVSAERYGRSGCVAETKKEECTAVGKRMMWEEEGRTVEGAQPQGLIA
jgi:hypothetical protein